MYGRTTDNSRDDGNCVLPYVSLPMRPRFHRIHCSKIPCECREYFNCFPAVIPRHAGLTRSIHHNILTRSTHHTIWKFESFPHRTLFFYIASIPLKASTSHPQHPDHSPSVLNPLSQLSSSLDPLTGSGSHLISPSLSVLMSCAPHFFAFYRDHLQLAQARHFYCWTLWRQR
jgi:hypothetical protein